MECEADDLMVVLLVGWKVVGQFKQLVEWMADALCSAVGTGLGDSLSIHNLGIKAPGRGGTAGRRCDWFCLVKPTGVSTMWDLGAGMAVTKL